MVDDYTIRVEDDENVFESYQRMPTPMLTGGNSCEVAKDAFMNSIKNQLSGANMQVGENVINMLNVYPLQCKDFSEMLNQLRLKGKTVPQVNQIAGRYFRIDKLPTRMLSPIATAIKVATVAALESVMVEKAWKKTLRR